MNSALTFVTPSSFIRRALPALVALVSLCGLARAVGADGAGAATSTAGPGSQSTPPSLAELTARGETAEREGRLTDAEALFARARSMDGLDLGPMRGACRVALALGKQADAREACHRAFMAGGIPEDSRHDVAALMVGPTPPKMNELVSALILAEGTVRVAPQQPWGYAARCDIALRLEDRDMLDACVADLRRVAPDHVETMRAVARAGALAASPWVWLGRLGLFLGFLGTVIHALRGELSRRAGRRPRRDAAGAIVLGSLLLLTLPASASGPASRHLGALSGVPIDDADPEAAVPDLKKQLENPLAFGYVLQDLLEGAATATKNGDYATAARFYRALTKAVPTRAYPFRKLCEAAEKVGDRAAAITACRQTLSGEDVTADDFSRFIRLTLATPGPLAPETMKDLEDVVQHLASQPGSTVLVAQERCGIALRVHDLPGLAACTAVLAQAAPNALSTVSFQWALEVERHDRAAARRLVDRARQLGLDQTALGKMEDASRRLEPRWRLMLPWLLGAVLTGALALVARRFWMERRKSSAA